MTTNYMVSNPYDNTEDGQVLDREGLRNKIMAKVDEHLKECNLDQNPDGSWINVTINTGGCQPTTCITISTK